MNINFSHPQPCSHAGEFLNIEVKFDFFAAESLATIKLDVGGPQETDFFGGLVRDGFDLCK